MPRRVFICWRGYIKLKVSVVTDKDGNVIGISPDGTEKIENEEVEIGMDPLEGEDIHHIDLPDDWQKWPVEEIPHKVKEILKSK